MLEQKQIAAIHFQPTNNQTPDKIGRGKKKSSAGKKRTEPATIGHNPSRRQFLRLEIMLEDFTAGISNRARVVHLEPSHSGGAPAITRFTFALVPVNIERMLRLPRDIDGPLLLLRHILAKRGQTSVAATTCISRERQ